MRNEIYFRNKGKVLLPPSKGSVSIVYVASALKNFEALNYRVSDKLFEALKMLSLNQLQKFHDEMIFVLKKMCGAHVTYRPMYPNFPKEVMDMNKAELYVNAVWHYLTLEVPSIETKWRPGLLEETKYKRIELGTKEEFFQIFYQIFKTKTSWSETNKEEVTWFTKTYPEKAVTLVSEMINKENLMFVLSLLMQQEATKDNNEFFKKYIKTAVDVMRLATAYSNGDVSLATNTKFVSFKRKLRIRLLGYLENCNNLEEDMYRYKKKWIRLGEKLHPGEYKDMFPKTFTSFDLLRNNKYVDRFNARYEKYYKQSSLEEVVKLLRQRPSEFARKLDALLRTTNDTELIINQFKNIIKDVSTVVLLQMLPHFEARVNDIPVRVFFPKGELAKAFGLASRITPFNEKIVINVTKIIKDELIKRFSDRKSLGKVYIDPLLKDYPVPMMMRSASKSLKTIPRGSKVFLEDKSTIRFFLWWKEGIVNGAPTGRVDLDLSSVLYDKNWKYVTHISYTNLKEDKIKGFHSGDITSAPNGACEFIDLNLESIVKAGGRYVITSVNSYTTQAYCDLPECFCGWMMRENPNSGEIFEPITVEQKYDLTADNKISIPAIIDAVERKIIWSDLSLKSASIFSPNNIESNYRGMTALGISMTNLNKMNLFDLFSLHASARGNLVSSKKEADVIYSINEGITPCDISLILSEYL
jgi:hypothetical protein